MRDAMDGKTAALEAELADVQAQLCAAEQDGAEIAALAEQTISSLRVEIARLKKGETQEGGDLCRSCQRKREIIASLVGGVFLGVWFRMNPPSEVDGGLTCLGIWFSVIPLLSVVVCWQLLLFRRKYSWVSWKDNDIYRRITARWNGSLERARMR